MKGQKPKIILSKCTRCYLCRVVCPVDAISIAKTGNPVIDYGKCNRCFICLRECPYSAIEEEGE
ncbi:MAG: 4Fe-4S binding protein [Candidatus Aenigmarchaeota archaeon]|nr:4Fe-4S binding protein [Candidatus Aenigmarchaeota archaeon]